MHLPDISAWCTQSMSICRRAGAAGVCTSERTLLGDSGIIVASCVGRFGPDWLAGSLDGIVGPRRHSTPLPPSLHRMAMAWRGEAAENQGPVVSFLASLSLSLSLQGLAGR